MSIESSPYGNAFKYKDNWMATQYSDCDVLRSKSSRCPSPPERVNVTWRRSEFGSDTFGLQVEVSDRSLGSVYLCVAKYPIVDGSLVEIVVELDKRLVLECTRRLSPGTR